MINAIKTELEKQHKTIEWLSVETDISLNVLSNFISGKAELSSGDLNKIASALKKEWKLTNRLSAPGQILKNLIRNPRNA